jgi:hypothetical protein
MKKHTFSREIASEGVVTCIVQPPYGRMFIGLPIDIIDVDQPHRPPADSRSHFRGSTSATAQPQRGSFQLSDCGPAKWGGRESRLPDRPALNYIEAWVLNAQ